MYCFYFILILIFSQCCQSQGYPSFQEFLNQFNKTYPDIDEYKMRQNLYNERVSKFGYITDFMPAVNHMTDWTQKERQERSSVFMPNITEEEKEKTHHLILKVGNPIELDWRQKGIVTSIKNQGSCGACWAFASVAYSQSRLIKQGKQDTNIDLSQQFLLSCTRESTCGGGYLENVFQTVTKKGGIPTQQKFPYNPHGINDPFICLTRDKETPGYYPQKIYQASDQELQNLLQDGPLAIVISSVGWDDYGSGVFRCKKGSKINHAVLLVGYTSSYWIIKNQWGEDWGEKGYIRVSKSRHNDANCKIGASAFYLWQGSYLRAIWLVLMWVMLILI